jgi:hypothetical protein
MVYSPPDSQPKLVYKRTLLVQNIIGSQDFLVIITLGSLDSLVYHSPGSFFGKPVLIACSKYSPVYASQGSRDFMVY